MLVNETSRLSQLTPAGITKLSATLAENGLMFSVAVREITETIKNMPVELIAPSMEWYADANNFACILADTYGVTVEIAAAVISAVSPRMPWLRNKSIAEQILNRFRNFDSELSAEEIAERFKFGLNANVAMAVKIARGESVADTLTGTKRRSFYNNIVSPYNGDSVTVDTWMARVIMRTTSFDLKTSSDLLRANRIALGGTGVGYFLIAEACRTVAKEMKLYPSQIQALYWTAVSGSTDGGREDIG